MGNTINNIPYKYHDCKRCRSQDISDMVTHNLILKTDCPHDCDRYVNYQCAISLYRALRDSPQHIMVGAIPR